MGRKPPSIHNVKTFYSTMHAIRDGATLHLTPDMQRILEDVIATTLRHDIDIDSETQHIIAGLSALAINAIIDNRIDFFGYIMRLLFVAGVRYGGKHSTM